jgi:acyl-CoA synthetase (AMP-forming)/AMP-acid ligase II
VRLTPTREAYNGFEHVCIDQAALASGFVPVPLHVVDNADSLAFVIADCGAAALIVDSVARWEALAPLPKSVGSHGPLFGLGPPERGDSEQHGGH